jgi:hypothetical protein
MQLYKMQQELDAQANDERLAVQYERQLQEYMVRSVPLGYDRYNRAYWSLLGDDRRIYVQQTTGRMTHASSQASIASAFPSGSMEVTAKNCQLLVFNKLFATRPHQLQTSWCVYSSSEIWELWDSLDERAEREGALKAAIKVGSTIMFRLI